MPPPFASCVKLSPGSQTTPQRFSWRIGNVVLSCCRVPTVLVSTVVSIIERLALFVSGRWSWS